MTCAIPNKSTNILSRIGFVLLRRKSWPKQQEENYRTKSRHIHVYYNEEKFTETLDNISTIF